MRATYRNDEDVARLHIESLLARHRRQVEALPEHLPRLYRRRVARSLAGQVALGGATPVLVTVAAPRFPDLGDLLPGAVTAALLASCALAACAYLAGLYLADARLRRALSLEVQRSGDVHADRARLEAAAPDARLRSMVDAEERRSVALPLTGFVVLAPLLLHLVVYRLLGWSLPWSELFVGFDWWIRASVATVGHVHAVAAYLAFRYARKLRQTATRDLADDPPPGAFCALGYAVLASALPGVALFSLSTIVVALTGASIMPAFAFARYRLLEERRQLGA
ncbi:hypothetical protein [Sorangium sp. So ce1099]|uniref:hypothetical protein n=1 Tax=Sorangium sp. So ce1099 TaxID=3133331 RepID=UPI003F6161BE